MAKGSKSIKDYSYLIPEKVVDKLEKIRSKSSNNFEKAKKYWKALKPYGFHKFKKEYKARGGIGTNRLVLFHPDHKNAVFKFGLDSFGIEDNYYDLERYKQLPRYAEVYANHITHVYSVQRKYKPCMTYDQIKPHIKSITKQLKKLSEDWLIVDLSPNHNFKNYGFDKKGDWVFIDASDLLPKYYHGVDIKVECQRAYLGWDKNGKRKAMSCAGKLYYEDCFHTLVCEKCGKEHNPVQLKPKFEEDDMKPNDLLMKLTKDKKQWINEEFANINSPEKEEDKEKYRLNGKSLVELAEEMKEITRSTSKLVPGRGVVTKEETAEVKIDENKRIKLDFVKTYTENEMLLDEIEEDEDDEEESDFSDMLDFEEEEEEVTILEPELDEESDDDEEESDGDNEEETEEEDEDFDDPIKIYSQEERETIDLIEPFLQGRTPASALRALLEAILSHATYGAVSLDNLEEAGLDIQTINNLSSTLEIIQEEDEDQTSYMDEVDIEEEIQEDNFTDDSEDDEEENDSEDSDEEEEYEEYDEDEYETDEEREARLDRFEEENPAIVEIIESLDDNGTLSEMANIYDDGEGVVVIEEDEFEDLSAADEEDDFQDDEDEEEYDESYEDEYEEEDEDLSAADEDYDSEDYDEGYIDEAIEESDDDQDEDDDINPYEMNQKSELEEEENNEEEEVVSIFKPGYEIYDSYDDSDYRNMADSEIALGNRMVDEILSNMPYPKEAYVSQFIVTDKRPLSSLNSDDIEASKNLMHIRIWRDKDYNAFRAARQNILKIPYEYSNIDASLLKHIVFISSRHNPVKYSMPISSNGRSLPLAFDDAELDVTEMNTNAILQTPPFNIENLINYDMEDLATRNVVSVPLNNLHLQKNLGDYTLEIVLMNDNEMDAIDNPENWSLLFYSKNRPRSNRMFEVNVSDLEYIW